MEGGGTPVYLNGSRLLTMKVARYTIQSDGGERHIWATSPEAASEAITQHTLGPWKCTMKGSRVFIDSKAKLSIACLDRTQKISPETEANARLIAAAPELLDACIRAHDFTWVDGCSAQSLMRGIREMQSDLRAAIAKAKGAT